MSTRKFELCFVIPIKQFTGANNAMLGKHLLPEEEAAGITLVLTRVRAFDYRSYQHALLAVRQRFFGPLHRRWFGFKDVDTDVFYALDSTEVASVFGCQPELEIKIVRPRRTLPVGGVVVQETATQAEPDEGKANGQRLNELLHSKRGQEIIDRLFKEFFATTALRKVARDIEG